MTVRRRGARRFERMVLGTVMSLVGFIIERRVLKLGAASHQVDRESQGEDRADAGERQRRP